MKTHESDFTFTNLVADGNVAGGGVTTVEFNNDGEQDVIIDGVHIIKPDTSKKFGGRVEVAVNKVFAVTFSGVGTKLCQVVFEDVSAL